MFEEEVRGHEMPWMENLSRNGNVRRACGDVVPLLTIVGSSWGRYNVYRIVLYLSNTTQGSTVQLFPVAPQQPNSKKRSGTISWGTGS